MRLRFWTAGLAFAGGVCVMAVGLSAAVTKGPPLPDLASAGLRMPALPVRAQAQAETSGLVPATAHPEHLPNTLPSVAPAGASGPDVEPEPATWSREIAPGETLDAVLAEAGLAATDRAEVALALGAEYDLRRLRPGHAVGVVLTVEGRLHRITLRVEDGIRIEATFGARSTIRTVAPDTELVTLAGEARIKTSLFAALGEAGMPACIVVDLAQMLGDAVDFRRDLDGDETLRLMWRQMT